MWFWIYHNNNFMKDNLFKKIFLNNKISIQKVYIELHYKY